MVGRLVEYQQVHGFEQQAYHGQTTALAAAEHLHTLIGSLAAEHECTEYVVYLQAYFAAGHIVDGLKDGQALVEQLSLVLGEVAYLHVVAHLQRALEGNLAHDTLHERRLALTVTTDEGHLLAALDGQPHLVEDGVVAVGLLQVLADDGIVAAPEAGRELQVHGGRVDIVHLDGHDLLELLHLLLYLYGLGCLVSESLYKRLHVSDFPLLVLVSP